MQTLNFETLYQNNFFLDFLDRKTQTQKFFNASFNSKEDFQKTLLAKENEEFLREELVAGLLVENKNLNASPKTLQNIELLAQNNTFAVVTGQQAGIFCGPLYTFYKTLTSVKLCEQLKIWFPEKNFVPVFWMETEDHDFNEVSKNYFLNQQGQLFEANYTEQPKTKIPVGNLIFTQKIDELAEEIFAKLGTTEFSEELKKIVSESYTKGNTFAESFGRFLHKTLGKFGVITINPHNSFWKEVAGVFFETAIQKNFEISKALFETAKELEKEGYKPQLNLPFENANLFLLLEGERRKLVREKE
ncbi:bacillithiol biosynthesis BshC, partial [bacterium]|nr:bacillithiol biosynthesis BshC [bacterium]